MAIEIEAPRIRSEETPREIITMDFKLLKGELPISGGWGYSKEDAVIIDKNDPVVPTGMPFDGVGIEYIFVEKRIYEELIIFRSGSNQFSGIKWNRIKQELISDGDRKFDVLFFDVTAIPDTDWEQLKSEWKSNNGFQESQSALDAHIEKRNSKTVHYQTEYWFDITSFFGKKLISEKMKNKYDLIDKFFSNPEDAVKFFVQLKVLKFANDDGSCIASLEKEAVDKWTYLLEWKDGEYVGEHIKPFKPSKENIDKFNNGCAGLARLLEEYIDKNDISVVTNGHSPFGDMVYEGSHTP
ncbi:MAG: hypothetical protein K9L30_02550 [Desulfobacterales bacterium]|nr:hypothetical protein [Desulfobacterales bacterium]